MPCPISPRRAASNAAIAAHDSALAASFHSVDGTLTPAGGSILRGRSAIQHAFATQFASDPALCYTRTPSHIQLQASTAIEAGTWLAVGTHPRGVVAPTSSGAYQAHWVLQSGSWLIQREVFYFTPATA